ncbi:MAG: hypothetical protein KME15_06475 [Drouetiella hepatica Uher 2000/2452]|uniref:Uncharacterized protein n=1 Tax=Drouetiella hepatica Uher 2000/2452 TaxID=904376 RepID=A0A951Q9C7_9CYAN|nr:hypothetical protein [Drouetiella hepatica Uher 2000/2452]
MKDAEGDRATIKLKELIAVFELHIFYGYFYRILVKAWIERSPDAFVAEQ